ncbi:MAG: hypothetical protein WKF42_09955 [Solirubrobacteraceae bacterium]
MEVVLVGRIALVVADLQIGGQAGDRPVTDEARAREPLRRVGTKAAVAERQPSVAGRVDLDRVQVDLATGGGDQYNAGGKTGLDRGVVPVAQRLERSHCPGTSIARDDEVEVVVGPRRRPRLHFSTLDRWVSSRTRVAL